MTQLSFQSNFIASTVKQSFESEQMERKVFAELVEISNQHLFCGCEMLRAIHQIFNSLAYENTIEEMNEKNYKNHGWLELKTKNVFSPRKLLRNWFFFVKKEKKLYTDIERLASAMHTTGYFWDIFRSISNRFFTLVALLHVFLSCCKRLKSAVWRDLSRKIRDSMEFSASFYVTEQRQRVY